jgi:hypothetical protein
MSKHKLLLVLGVVAVVLAMTPGLFAQSDPKAGYAEWVTEAQSRNIPAGSVNDPGSHLTYILDTGVNARKEFGTALRTKTSSVLVDMASKLDTDGDGNLDPGAIIQNFVAITNTHPTMAVTIHFRYYNDNCEDVLDFLVLLTCNDTLLFDPFNYVIPATGNLNTANRFFKASANQVLTPISTLQWGSGRFVLTAAASGANIDQDDDVEILFPYELGEANKDFCNVNKGTSVGPGPLDATLAGSVGNVGIAAGLVASNLHVFNASQISFNFLIGMQTYAKSVVIGGQPDFQAGGANAWARPAIYRGLDENRGISGWPDGDADFAPTGKLVLGTEGLTNYPGGAVWQINNSYYLRNEVHGGDVQWNGLGDSWSNYGAQGTAPFFTAASQATDMVMHFLSVADDYNGSTNVGAGSQYPDKAANIEPAATVYVMQIYDNDEDPLILQVAPPLNVSPPVVGEVVELKITCICLRTFFTTTIAPGTNLDDFTVAEIANAGVPEILAGDGAKFDGLFKAKGSDISGGWIRFVRDNTVQIDITATGANGDGLAAGVDLGRYLFSGTGTATINAPGFRDHYAGASFVTISNAFTTQGGFGALWWNYAVPASALVSELGDPNFDRARGH